MLVLSYLQQKRGKGEKKATFKNYFARQIDAFFFCHCRQVPSVSFIFLRIFLLQFFWCRRTYIKFCPSFIPLSLFPFHFPCVSFLYLSYLDQVENPAGSSSHVGLFRNLMVSARVYLYSGFHQVLYWGSLPLLEASLSTWPLKLSENEGQTFVSGVGIFHCRKKWFKSFRFHGF